MRCAPPSQLSPSRDRSPRRALRMAVVCAVAWIAGSARAGDRLVIQGQISGEVWDTGTQSLLLARNEGDTAGQGRLRLWMAGQLGARVQGMILGRFEDGQASEYITPEPSYAELEQAWLRWTLPTNMRLVAQGGRMPQPLGGFSHRYLPDQNPLIGHPATYDIAYPGVVQLAGSTEHYDFLVAVTDQPMGRQIWLPGATSAARPALAAGITPFTGFRIGAYGTWGPYLSDGIQNDIPAGYSWRDYDQSVVGLDVSFSRGHFELFGEMTRSFYEVPEENDERGIVWYLEPKYTWSPRWFTALRIERNYQASVWFPDYAGGPWYVTDENSWDVEAGAGFRIDPRTVVKASYRVERSSEYPTYEPQTDHAIAVQLSCNFDVTSWFERPD